MIMNPAAGDVCDKLCRVGNQVEARQHDIERCFGNAVVIFEACDARRHAVLIKGDVHDRDLLHFAPAIRPAERDVHSKVHRPKRFAALRRAPDHRQPGASHQPLHEIAAALIVDRNAAEWREHKPRALALALPRFVVRLKSVLVWLTRTMPRAFVTGSSCLVEVALEVFKVRHAGAYSNGFLASSAQRRTCSKSSSACRRGRREFR
jgi:hypothetical protein